MRQEIMKMGFSDTVFCIETDLMVFCYCNFLSTCIECSTSELNIMVFSILSPFPCPDYVYRRAYRNMFSPPLLQRSMRKYGVLILGWHPTSNGFFDNICIYWINVNCTF